MANYSFTAAEDQTSSVSILYLPARSNWTGKAYYLKSDGAWQEIPGAVTFSTFKINFVFPAQYATPGVTPTRYKITDSSDKQIATGIIYLKEKPATVDPGGSATIPNAIDLASATDAVTEITINDDGSASTNWPNRWAWYYKPLSLAKQLVQWTNEYGELRLIPAKVNTVALRVFGKQQAGDQDHQGPVLEVQDSRTARNSMWSVDGAGNMTSVGTVTAKNIGAKVIVLEVGQTQPDPGDAVPGAVVLKKK